MNCWFLVWCCFIIEGGVRVWKSGRVREIVGVSYRKENIVFGEVRGILGGYVGKWIFG